jgi:hypothetical protein
MRLTAVETPGVVVLGWFVVRNAVLRVFGEWLMTAIVAFLVRPSGLSP